MKIIGISGKMGSGKDYIAQNYIIPYIKKNMLQYMCLSFADQIKINVICKNDIRYEDVFVNKSKETRRLLQIEGTENGRKQLGEDIWIKYHENWSKIHESRGIDILLTNDVRFKNEIEYIKAKGGMMIKVIAPDRTEERLRSECKGNEKIYDDIKSHSSECELDDVDDKIYDIIINNKKTDKIEINQMYKKLDEFIHVKV
jgi:hypothetical protein